LKPQSSRTAEHRLIHGPACRLSKWRENKRRPHRSTIRSGRGGFIERTRNDQETKQSEQQDDRGRAVDNRRQNGPQEATAGRRTSRSPRAVHHMATLTSRQHKAERETKATEAKDVGEGGVCIARDSTPNEQRKRIPRSTVLGAMLLTNRRPSKCCGVRLDQRTTANQMSTRTNEMRRVQRATNT
jgi:hypothetical protein